MICRKSTTGLREKVTHSHQGNWNLLHRSSRDTLGSLMLTYQISLHCPCACFSLLKIIFMLPSSQVAALLPYHTRCGTFYLLNRSPFSPHSFAPGRSTALSCLSEVYISWAGQHWLWMAQFCSVHCRSPCAPLQEAPSQRVPCRHAPSLGRCLASTRPISEHHLHPPCCLGQGRPLHYLLPQVLGTHEQLFFFFFLLDSWDPETPVCKAAI